MYDVSSRLIRNCNDDVVYYKEYIIIDDVPVIIKGNFSDDCYSDGNIVGTFIMKKLEFETENDIDYKGKEFDYYRLIGTESFKIGTFIVTEVKDTDTTETVRVVSYDYALKFDVKYETELNYSSNEVTLEDVIEEVCNKLDIVLYDTIPVNSGFIVDSNQFDTNALYGDVVVAVAQMCGCFAKITENNELQFLLETRTDEVIESYEELDDKRDTRPITIVSLGMQDVEGENVTLRWEEGIAQYGENIIAINDNPFAYTQQKRIQLITGIYNHIIGFSYSSFESKFAFKPYLKVGDRVKIKNKAGELIDSIVLRINANHEDITLSAPSIIKATVNYQQQLSAIDLIKRTELIVDKQEQTITGIISQQDNISTTIEQMRVDMNGIENRLTQSGGNNIFYYKSEFWNTDNILPQEYQQVEYIESNGTQYINTNIIPTSQNVKIEYSFNYNSIVNGKALYSINNPTADADWFVHYKSASYNLITHYLGSTTITSAFNFQINTTYKEVMEANNGVYRISVNDIQQASNTYSGTISNLGSLMVSGRKMPNGTIQSPNAKTYYVKFWDNGILVCNLIPCYRKSDNEIGLYDLVNKTFYTNLGTGTFLKGEDVAPSTQEVNIEETTNTEIQQNSISRIGYIVNSGSCYQEINNLINGTYTISFKYKKLGTSLTTFKVVINGTEYELTETNWTEFSTTLDVTSHTIKIEIIGNSDGIAYISDILGEIGTGGNIWTQNPNETMTDTVTIGRGVEVRNSNVNTYTRIDADGTRIFSSRDNQVVAEFTDEGTETKDIKAITGEIAGILIREANEQTWIIKL